MTLPGFHECSECEGTGWADKGELVAKVRAAKTGMRVAVAGAECSECGGAGQVPDDDTVEVAAEPIHNKRPKCYESWGNEDDGCFCLAKTRAALLAYARHTQETKPEQEDE